MSDWKQGLRFGGLGEEAVHLCVDMQRVFAEDTPWHMPWMPRVLPQVARLATAHAARNVFTRFMPPHRAEEMQGSWRRYYERWHQMTRAELGDAMLELVPELRQLVPPGVVVEKPVYSPWFGTSLERMLRHRGSTALIVSGGETDVCVLASVLGGVDRGFRVILASDALCSSSDEAHDASLTVYGTRYGQHVEVASVEEILAAWE